MTQHGNSTPNVKIPVPADPAYVYGLQLGQEMDEQERLQELEYEASHAKQHRPECIYTNAEAHQNDLVLALRDMISSVRATTLQGSLVQIAVAIDVMSSIDDQYPEEGKDYQVRCQFRAVGRLLFSAITALNDLAGGELTRLHKSHFGVSYCDPWKDPDEAVVRSLETSRQDKERAAARRQGGAA